MTFLKQCITVNIHKTVTKIFNLVQFTNHMPTSCKFLIVDACENYENLFGTRQYNNTSVAFFDNRGAWQSQT